MHVWKDPNYKLINLSSKFLLNFIWYTLTLENLLRSRKMVNHLSGGGLELQIGNKDPLQFGDTIS